MSILDQVKPQSCSCSACKSMCLKAPCLPTPDDVLKISLAGHSDKLCITIWAAGLFEGFYPKAIKVVAPIMTPKGCSFLTSDFKCQLHDLNLKPLGGRLAMHTNTAKDTQDIETFIAEQWLPLEKQLNSLK